MIKLSEILDNQYIIYLDMDGVLCDFDKQFIKYAGVTADVYSDRYGRNEVHNVWDEAGVAFWAEMKPLPEGMKLYTYLKNQKLTFKILSAYQETSKTETIRGKKIWIQKYMAGTPAIFVTREHKKDYAKKNSVLIDDYKSNVREFNGAGGNGIVFRTFNGVVKQLHDLLKK